MSKQDTLCILGNGSHWSGLLEFEGSARIDSDFHGDIRTKGQLIIGPDAEVRGTLDVGELDVFGRVRGDVVAGRKLTLRAGASVEGNLDVGRIEAEEGSLLNGRIRMACSANEDRPRRSLFARHAEPLGSTLPRAWTKNA